MPLSDLAVRQAKATGKPYTITDIDGLSLAVSAAGGKAWHFRYPWLGKQKRMSFGTYPEVTLREARALKDEARALVAKGINPRAHRKQKRFAARLAGENTFEGAFRSWQAHRALTLKKGRNTSVSQADRLFKNDVLPTLGKRPIYDIQRHDLLEVLAKIERRKAFSQAEKLRGWFNQMFRFALVKVPGLQHNPAFDLDVVAIPAPPVRHNPHLRLEELPECLRMLRNYPGRLNTQLGLRMLLLTGVRTGELRLATPTQFHLDQGLWIIPPEVVKQLLTKIQRERLRPGDIPPYIVPLSVQAQEIVRHLLDDFKPAQIYLFPSDWSLRKTLSENTLNAALKRMGFKNRLTGHGIRGTISTALHEVGYPEKWVDAQLSHVDPNAVRATYNHAEYVEQRRRMMQDWADRLDQLEQGLVEEASRHLPFTPEGMQMLTTVPAVNWPTTLVPTSPPIASAGGSQPMPAAANSSITVARLSAVRLPVTALQSELSEDQKARLARLSVFNSARMLPLPVFAKAVGKSKRWIAYEVRAGKLLALSMGNRGKRIPDWHLDPVKHHLIQTVLKYARDADPWLVYDALTHSCRTLENRAPIDAVERANVHEAAMAACMFLREADPFLASVA